MPYQQHRTRFLEQWHRAANPVWLADKACDGGKLMRASHNVLLAHEDKKYSGAFVASASIPWGQSKGDDDLGGYHLVWTRDMVHTAGAMLACGRAETARRALVYLACTQEPDGGFAQNFWVDGRPYWSGVQLDEVAFPIILAWRLWKADGLGEMHIYPFVERAAGFLVVSRPDHPPGALGRKRRLFAIDIGGRDLRSHLRGGDHPGARYRRPGDLPRRVCRLDRRPPRRLDSHQRGRACIPKSSATTCASGLRRPARPMPAKAAPTSTFASPTGRPARALNLRRARSSTAVFWNWCDMACAAPTILLMADSLKVVDLVLKRTLPQGPGWLRYNYDGYGDRPDGGPFLGWGQGRPWPLLTGERAHYELAAGQRHHVPHPDL